MWCQKLRGRCKYERISSLFRGGGVKTKGEKYVESHQNRVPPTVSAPTDERTCTQVRSSVGAETGGANQTAKKISTQGGLMKPKSLLKRFQKFRNFVQFSSLFRGGGVKTKGEKYVESHQNRVPPTVSAPTDERTCTQVRSSVGAETGGANQTAKKISTQGGLMKPKSLLKRFQKFRNFVQFSSLFRGGRVKTKGEKYNPSLQRCK